MSTVTIPTLYPLPFPFRSVHHLNVWQHTSDHNVLMAHLVVGKSKYRTHTHTVETYVSLYMYIMLIYKHIYL